MVGCVIVHDNTIIGEGFTSPYGGNHAEVNAILSVVDKSLLAKAELYVTLEPCSHLGKTPPCSDLIIQHQIPKIIIGCQDDNPEVSGQGIQRLKDAGCEVTIGILENECRHHHKRFFTFHNKNRPYIILKWAQSSDGYIAPYSKDNNEPVWITNEYSRQLVHKWRSEEQAILVGTNTVLEDNPSLTVRNWTGQHPTRVVIDKNNKLSRSLNVFNDVTETIVISKNNIDFTKPIAHQICALLFEKKITSIIIEGGLQTLQTFIDENLWDEARVFTGTLKLKQGMQCPVFSGQPMSTRRIGDDIVNSYQNG